MSFQRFLFLVIATFLFLAGCANGDGANGNLEVDPEADPVQEEPSETEAEEPQEDPVDEEEETQASPEEVADEIVMALQKKEMETISDFVHPRKGVRFSPYAFVQVNDDKVFTAEEVADLFNDETVYNWGSFDGTGEPIEMTFEEYFERFVYDQDYVNAEQKSVNERLGQGNTLDNTAEVYPEASVVEYHFASFDPQYDGMDWRSLRLVLENVDGTWYLVGVIHDEWTI
ncbi:hypothetical protein H1D32_11280 [Anaerobacillus sp. CMMVII]|uniref:hypothetical protein n=1 Tax=Anaerobacillus sp. CMMVII TaxID=2755588 RepID=UPI0021B7290E|nr:hypothetical protein [Anaerobacillus sp. CMMVII]MCT8138280.1 hypothetical protein [Anaerobacillus sp. CMMVII]